MWPLGLFKCQSCGGTSYFSEDGISYDEDDKYWDVNQKCECFVGFGKEGQVYVRDLPDDCIIIYREADEMLL